MSVTELKEPATIAKIDWKIGPPRLTAPIFPRDAQGKFVKVRQAGEDKTYLGVYLGDLPIGGGFAVQDDTLVLESGWRNPAIWVPALNQLVYGAESWWGVIKSEDDLREITDADINDIWYVKALKAVGEGNEGH